MYIETPNEDFQLKAFDYFVEFIPQNSPSEIKKERQN